MTRQPPAPSNAAHPVTRPPSVSAQAAPDEAKTKEAVPTFSRIPDTPPMRPTILKQNCCGQFILLLLLLCLLRSPFSANGLFSANPSFATDWGRFSLLN